MLPVLATIGSGLAWFAATAGQLIFWGAFIGTGFWLGKKWTNAIDDYGNKKLAFKLWKKHNPSDENAEVTAAASTRLAPQT